MGDKKLLKEMGARIKARRKELNMTQEQLAEKMDVSINMISNLELGRKAIRPENLVKVCDILNMSADYILRGKFSETDNTELYKRFLNIPEKHRKPLEALIFSLSEE